jgi:tripartite-type tricarboxylate transporter receptor subunit TctC
MFAVPGSAMPHVRSGRLTALAVTSLEASPLAPGLPTVAAALPGYESVSYLAIFVPAGTRAPVVTRLNEAIVRALQKPDVKEKFFSVGLETLPTTPDQLAYVVHSDMKKSGELIMAAGIRAD